MVSVAIYWKGLRSNLGSDTALALQPNRNVAQFPLYWCQWRPETPESSDTLIFIQSLNSELELPTWLKYAKSLKANSKVSQQSRRTCLHHIEIHDVVTAAEHPDVSQSTGLLRGCNNPRFALLKAQSYCGQKEK